MMVTVGWLVNILLYNNKLTDICRIVFLDSLIYFLIKNPNSRKPIHKWLYAWLQDGQSTEKENIYVIYIQGNFIFSFYNDDIPFFFFNFHSSAILVRLVENAMGLIKSCPSVCSICSQFLTKLAPNFLLIFCMLLQGVKFLNLTGPEL